MIILFTDGDAIMCILLVELCTYFLLSYARTQHSGWVIASAYKSLSRNFVRVAMFSYAYDIEAVEDT